MYDFHLYFLLGRERELRADKNIYIRETTKFFFSYRYQIFAVGSNMSKCSKSAKEYSVKGEKSLAEGNFSEALDNFNNCLRFASVDSDESSRAFAARANIFYNVKLYRECSENIQLAKHDINVFNEDLRRIEEEISLVESDNCANKWNFFKLSHDANKQIPFIVNCLEVRQDETYGRYIATTKDLLPGDILIIEEPFYKVLSPLEIHRRCSICFKQNSLNLLPCATCSTGITSNFHLFLHHRVKTL